MKVKYFIYLFAVVLLTIAVNLKDRRNQDLNLVANIEAFSAANDESESFNKYYKSSSFTIITIVGENEPKTTTWPCCEKVNDPFSGCSSYLPKCPENN